MASPRIAVVFYSTWGHVLTLAKAEAAGVTKAGGKATLYQIPETLPTSILEQMHAPPKDASVQTLSSPSTLLEYDGFLLGIPTRYGNFPTQWKSFWDSTGQIWKEGGFQGKFAGLFVSSGTQGGGQESTNMAAMSTLAHLGMIYVPLGTKTVMPLIAEMSEVRGGSAWGAGTFAGLDGSRQPSEKELEMATEQGRAFCEILSRVSPKQD